MTAFDLGPADLADGGLRETSAGELSLGLARVGDLVRLRDLVHAECLTDGWLEGEAVRCACHGSLFALATGEPLEGPATEPIETFPVFLRDGWRMSAPGTQRERPVLQPAPPAGRLARGCARARGRHRGGGLAKLRPCACPRAADRRAHPHAVDRQLPESPSPVLEVLDDRLALDETIPRCAPLLRLRRLLRPRDRCARRPAGFVLRRKSRRVGRRGVGGRGSGGRAGWPSSSASRRRRRLHERRHRLEHDGPRCRPRASRPRVPPCGFRPRQATLYCSEEAHYSIERAAEILGIGSANVRALPIDGERRLVPEAVREAIAADRAEGRVPVAVVATAGTTLTGAVDPIGALADVCAERGCVAPHRRRLWPARRDDAVGRAPVRRARPRRFRHARRPQVAVSAQGVRRAARPRRAPTSSRPSPTRRHTSRTSARGGTWSTSRSSTHARFAP